MTATRNALIIGAGIAGPVAALALRLTGVDAAVYDATMPGREETGLTLTLAPNGQEALRIVGALDAVRAIGLPMSGQQVTDGRGRRVGVFPPVAGQPPVLALRRAELCQALRAQAEAAGVAMHYGARLVDIEEDGACVSAVFEDGRTASADVLVGADGIRSRVRSIVDPDAPSPRQWPLLNLGGIADTVVADKPDQLYFVFGRRDSSATGPNRTVGQPGSPTSPQTSPMTGTSPRPARPETGSTGYETSSPGRHQPNRSSPRPIPLPWRSSGRSRACRPSPAGPEGG
jgi:2-polyprenyl-6-methoxyphenol hydroxylase-like FAD-dependent oxidoreductase